jgi:LPXTG-motif cell wall-anchored protein
VNIVHGSTFPQPDPRESPVSPSERQLPATGQGTRTPGAILVGLLGTIIAAIGLGVCATGLRTRKLG